MSTTPLELLFSDTAVRSEARAAGGAAKRGALFDRQLRKAQDFKDVAPVADVARADATAQPAAPDHAGHETNRGSLDDTNSSGESHRPDDDRRPDSEPAESEAEHHDSPLNTAIDESDIPIAASGATPEARSTASQTTLLLTAATGESDTASDDESSSGDEASTLTDASTIVGATSPSTGADDPATAASEASSISSSGEPTAADIVPDVLSGTAVTPTVRTTEKEAVRQPSATGASPKVQGVPSATPNKTESQQTEEARVSPSDERYAGLAETELRGSESAPDSTTELDGQSRLPADARPRIALAAVSANSSSLKADSDERTNRADATRITSTANTDGNDEGVLNAVSRFAYRINSSGPGASAGAERIAPRVDGARFVSRVARAFQIAQQRGGGLQLRLSPPELGSLRLEVSVQQGVLTAKIDAESIAARQALLDNLPVLRERLAEQNIRIERFDVDVHQENGNGGQRFDFEEGRQGRQSPPHHAAESANRDQPSASELRPIVVDAITGDDNINLLI